MQIDLKFIEMEEIWKDIEGYEGLYQVSNLGRVKSLRKEANIRNGGIRSCSERILKQRTACGYKMVNLNKNNHQYTYRVHTLVMLAFVGERPEGMEIDHKDNNRSNNKVENLRYVTSQENTNNPNSSITKAVAQCSLQGEFIRKWKSAREVERLLGFNHSSITQCCKGNYTTAYGYQWRYA